MLAKENDSIDILLDQNLTLTEMCDLALTPQHRSYNPDALEWRQGEIRNRLHKIVHDCNIRRELRLSALACVDLAQFIHLTGVVHHFVSEGFVSAGEEG